MLFLLQTIWIEWIHLKNSEFDSTYFSKDLDPLDFLGYSTNRFP